MENRRRKKINQQGNEGVIEIRRKHCLKALTKATCFMQVAFASATIRTNSKNSNNAIKKYLLTVFIFYDIFINEHMCIYYNKGGNYVR